MFPDVEERVSVGGVISPYHIIARGKDDKCWKAKILSTVGSAVPIGE